MSNKIKFVPLPLFPTSSRGATELREVDFRTGLVPEATGSCWYSAGSGAYSTKVCCCVLGPKPVKQVSLAGHVFSLIVSQRSGTEPRPLHHLCAAHRSSRAPQKARMPSLHAMLNSPVSAAARACMLCSCLILALHFVADVCPLQYRRRNSTGTQSSGAHPLWCHCHVSRLRCASRVSMHQLPNAAARRPRFSPACACIASPKAKSRFTAGAHAAFAEHLNATHPSQVSLRTAAPCCRVPSLPRLSLSLTPASTARSRCLGPGCL